MCRLKVGWRSASRSQYTNFCNNNKDISISIEKWREVIYGFNREFRDHILSSGDKAKVPFGFGDLTINKRKTKKMKMINGVEVIALPIDWKKTRAKGKHVYNFNYHTEGFRFKWMWFPRTARFRHADVWVFKPFRESSRRITEFLNRTDNNYVDVYKEWR